MATSSSTGTDPQVTSAQSTSDPSANFSVSAITVPRAKSCGTPVTLRVKILEGETVVVDVLETDTVEYLKGAIWSKTGIPPGEQHLVAHNQCIQSTQTVSQCRLNTPAVVTLIREETLPQVPTWTGTKSSVATAKFYGRGRRSPFSWMSRETEAEKAGLHHRATAKSLHPWDGRIPNGPKGLTFAAGELIMIGRVVDSHWYQGYNGKDEVGYIPRNYVVLTDVMDEKMRPEIGSDAPPPRKSPVPLPPTPFPQVTDKSTYDMSFSQSRLIAVFAPVLTLEPPFPLQITLTLVAAPGARVAAATFSATFLDGSIVALSPEDVASARTEVRHADTHSSEGSVNFGTPSGLPAQVGGSMGLTNSEAQEFTRSTWGRIQGAGVGTRRALWVFEEDQGRAGRHGVPIEHTTERLTINLSVRPAVCEYQIKVTLVKGDGTEPTLFNKREYDSGPQRVLLT